MSQQKGENRQKEKYNRKAAPKKAHIKTILGYVAIALIGTSLPGFWFALVLILLFSSKLGWLPAYGVGGIQYWIMPIISTAFAGITTQPQATANRFCDQCGAELTPGAAFCDECGAPQATPDTCAKCGFKFIKPGKFCPKCGAKREG